MILSPDERRPGWELLPGGSWLFTGDRFSDERGTSDELCSFEQWPASLEPFVVAQENVVVTHAAGCARGLHYQVAPYAQAKLVTVLRGSAQFFWLPLVAEASAGDVFSIVLKAGATSLYTPPDCAHGVLALADETQFLLRMSRPVSLPHRGEISFQAQALAIDFATTLDETLFSPRDRNAPEWKMRRHAAAQVNLSE